MGRGLGLAAGTFPEEVISQTGVGVQNESPQDVPLWYADFELKATKTVDSGESSDPPSFNYLEFKLGDLPISDSDILHTNSNTSYQR